MKSITSHNYPLNWGNLSLLPNNGIIQKTMPIIKSAKKKLKQDIARQKHNQVTKNNYKEAAKKAVNSHKNEDIRKAISLINKAAKNNIIHKNKASRLTSKLSKLVTKNLKKRKKVEKKSI